MMRPYLAVIVDSFREALASRVLWILLVVITLVLLGLTPLGLDRQVGSYLTEDDILDSEKLIDRIVAAGKEEDKPSPGRRIWEHLDAGMQQTLRSEPPAEQFGRRMREITFLGALRDQLASEDFYGKVEWDKTRMPAEALLLQRKEIKNLDEQELARFNRLALNAAFEDLIAPAPAKQIQVTYFAWELGIPLPVEPEELYPAINQLLVATLSLLLGAFGVFVAVLVTSSMIPRAFEAGSVDLLLSKPVWRSGVFLAKFVGGCAFIAINAAYFIIGLWLILGLRIGLWNERLLWAIPLYVFLFSIYFGVSALAGLIWRNAIVSVVLTVVFWFVCFALGSAVNVIDALSLTQRRLQTVVPAGETLIAVNATEVLRWDDAEKDWKPIFAPRPAADTPFIFPTRLAGPVYDPQGERILAFRATGPRFPAFGSVNRLLVGSRDDDWRRTEGVNVPDGAAALFVDKKGEVLVAASTGVYRLQGDLAARQDDINFFGFHVPLPETGGKFVPAGPEMTLPPVGSAARDEITGTVVLFSGMQLVAYARDDRGQYQPETVRFDRRLSGKVAAGGGVTWLVLAGGEARPYGAKLEPQPPIDSGVNSVPNSAAVSPDGRYLAVVYQNARLWLYDTQQKREVALDDDDVSAIAFDGGKLLVADRVSRVTEYDLSDLSAERRWQGAMPLVEIIYRYALHPLYTVFPKPGELNQTVNHVLTSDDTKIAGLRIEESRGVPTQVNVWGPVWSNLAFLAVVLLISCVYVQRKDF